MARTAPFILDDTDENFCPSCWINTCNISGCNEQITSKDAQWWARRLVHPSSSQRLSKLTASQVGQYYCNKCATLEWNQSSDRPLPAGKGVIMGMKMGRPGSGVTQPVGGCVDIKHNSYDRRLRKLKAKVLSS